MTLLHKKNENNYHETHLLISGKIPTHTPDNETSSWSEETPC